MSVEKFEGSSEKGFTTLLNKTLQDINCMEALGMYSYLMSLSSKWEIYPKQLAKHFNCGKEKIYRILNWLIQEGFITCTTEREKGKFTKPHYRVHLSRNQPIDQKVDLVENQSETRDSTEFSPCPEKPDTVKPDTENQDTYKIYNIKNIYNKNNINNNTVDFEKSTERDKVAKSDYCSNDTENEFEQSKCINNTDYFIKSDYRKNQIRNDSLGLKNNQKKERHYKDDALFMRFYTAYPQKQKPVIAYKAFLKHKPDEDFVEMLLLDLKMRMNNNWKYRHKSKIPFPAKYLNGSEWEGEIYEPESQEEIQKLQEPRYGLGRPSAGNVIWS